MTLTVKKFISPPLHNNNYVVIDSESHEAVMIDCSDRTDAVMDYILEQKATLKYILLTHGHFDHVMGVNYFLEKYHIPTYIAAKDEPLLKQINQYTDWMGLSKINEPKVYGTIEENHPFIIGKHVIKILETPGHTPGGVCYLIDDVLFSGDTLFQNSYGRTDFPGGDDKTMHKSLRYLFKTLSDEVKVYPGHGDETTIGSERHLYK